MDTAKERGKSMTPQFWKHIQPQLDEQIRDVLSECNPASDLLKTLNDTYWWDKAPFNKMRVWDERNDLTLIEWSNAVGSLMGDDMSDIFDELMKERLKATINHQWELRMQDLAEDYEAEMRNVA